MAFTAPATVVSGSVITSAYGNQQIRDNIAYLKAVQDGTLPGQIPAAALTNPLLMPEVAGGGYRYGARAVFTSNNGITQVNNNCRWTGTGYYVDDLSRPAWLMEIGIDQLGSTDEFAVYRSPAGTNPCVFGLLFRVDGTGKLTGAGFYDSGEFALASGASTTLIHGLGAKPRILGGYLSAVAGEVAGTAPTQLLDASTTVSVTGVSSTQITVYNGAAGTRYGRVTAML